MKIGLIQNVNMSQHSNEGHVRECKKGTITKCWGGVSCSQKEGREGTQKTKWMYNEVTIQDLEHFRSINESRFSTKN
jgi:hypothetical protein